MIKIQGGNKHVTKWQRLFSAFDTNYIYLPHDNFRSEGLNQELHGICVAAITVVTQYDFDNGRPPFQIR